MTRRILFDNLLTLRVRLPRYRYSFRIHLNNIIYPYSFPEIILLIPQEETDNEYYEYLYTLIASYCFHLPKS